MKFFTNNFIIYSSLSLWKVDSDLQKLNGSMIFVFMDYGLVVNCVVQWHLKVLFTFKCWFFLMTGAQMQMR